MRITTDEPINWTLTQTARDNRVVIDDFPSGGSFEISIRGETVMRHWISSDAETLEVFMRDLYSTAFWRWWMSDVLPNVGYCGSGFIRRETWHMKASTVFDFGHGNQVVTWDSVILENRPVWEKLPIYDIWSYYGVKLLDAQSRFGFVARKPLGVPFSVGMPSYNSGKITLKDSKDNVIAEWTEDRAMGYEYILSDCISNIPTDEFQFYVSDKNGVIVGHFIGIDDCKFPYDDNVMYLRWFSWMQGYRYGIFEVRKTEIQSDAKQWEAETWERKFQANFPTIETVVELRRKMRDDFDRWYFSDFLISPYVWRWNEKTKKWETVRFVSREKWRPEWWRVNEIQATAKIVSAWA